MMLTIWSFLVRYHRVTIPVITIGLLLTALWAYGNAQYNKGVEETTAAFLKADQEGASNVREVASKTLADIGSDFDADSLLESTNGLRDN